MRDHGLLQEAAVRFRSSCMLDAPITRAITVAIQPHKYLVETSPLLTDLKQFMSSDYLLAGLGYNPDESAKRLGDGFYEQRLLQQAVVAATGQRFLAGQTSDEQMFKYLMDNAIASKQQLNLAVGVGLTSEQVAALTHDIVWLEEVTVNGEKVLVPVLYMANANNRLAPNGALVAGNDVNLVAGQDLLNVGTLRASNNLSAAAGNDIINSGLIQAGNRVDLLAGNDIVNKAGGIISGRDISMTALKGDVINERSVTSQVTDAARLQARTDYVDSAARIEAANDLSINVGRDFVSAGGVLQSGRDTSIEAGRDILLGSAEAIDSAAYGRTTTQSVTQNGSSVSAGRDFTAVAGRDLTAVASQIEAQRAIDISAAGDVTLMSAADETHSAYTSKKLKTQEDHVSQVSTVLTAGSDVSISAGQDLALSASRISAGDEAYLVAGGQLALLAAEDLDYSLYDKKKKGSFGSKYTKRDEVTQVTNVGSAISTGGDLMLVSGGDQLYQAAKLDSGADLIIDSGGAVTFEAVKDLHQESHEKSKGNLAWQSAKGKGQTDETVRQSELNAQGNLAIKAVDGLKIDYKHLDQQSVSQAIDAMVEVDPNLAWLKDAEKRGDVDWRQVQEIHDSWKYSNSGLGAAPSLIIAIVAAAYLGPLYGAMASKLAIGTINNNGDLGRGLKFTFSKEALKSYAVTVATAYVVSPYLDEAFGVSTDNASKITKGFDLNNVTDIAKFSAFLAAQGVAQAGVETALGGGSFGENLKTSLTAQAGNLGMAIGFNLIGDWSLGKYPDGSPQKIMAHALFGGLMAEAMGGEFKTGALAAGANEALSNALVTLVGGDDRLEVMASQIVGVLAAATVDGDLEQGSEIAKYATAYNQQVHRQAKERLEQGLKVLQGQGKYLDLDAETVLADLRKIADGNLSSSAELNPKIVQFLNAEFSPAALRDTLFEPEDWEQYAALAIDLLFPTPSTKTAAARRIADKVSGETLEALEAKFGADLLKGGAKDAIDLNAQASLSVSKITAPIDFDGHILSAEVKKNGSVVGGHSTAMGEVKVIPGTASAPNAQGVYTAKVQVADPANPGQFLPKTNNGGISTLFPDSWTADRVKVEVDAAFKNRTVVGNKWSGTTPSGVKVEGYITPKTTVYPKY
ncbi:filamentous hemagglutinin [Pseudomonas sp. URMO17WK12:I5]|uniref:DUF637 domain-containing protein n=1 Tax=unclassified Pseudomonas TaxID=196821 RepID=UPI000A08B192|nr:filamentous hemagglutinin [Pseudomonas sp. URMO17WK12:I7]SMF07939.1 filamentous hemagglutinin [Pseudomonas sp. URMO17WK12:I5]